jgi:hypothetical protein
MLSAQVEQSEVGLARRESLVGLDLVVSTP